MTKTKAQEALVAKLAERGLSQSELAAMLHVRQSNVSRWVLGSGRPQPHLRRAIEARLGIPQDDWLTTKEARLLARIIAEAA